MKNLFLFLTLSLFVFYSCEKETITTNEANERVTESYHQSPQKAGFDCVLNDAFRPIHDFEYCTGEFTFQGELTFSNDANGFHTIQAISKCHKQGDPGNFIPIRQMTIEISGNMHIGCGIPINVQVPSDYNSNLVLGQVPFQQNCHNCGISSATIFYHKLITQLPGDELRAKITFKMDYCGDVYIHTMNIAI